jgi:hypothetical protein
VISRDYTSCYVAGSPLAGRDLHLLDAERSFMKSSHPPILFDQQGLVALFFLSVRGGAVEQRLWADAGVGLRAEVVVIGAADIARLAGHVLLQRHPVPFLERSLARRLAAQPGDTANDLVAQDVGGAPHAGLRVDVVAADAGDVHPQQAGVGGDVRHGVLPDLEGLGGDYRGGQYSLRHGTPSCATLVTHRPALALPWGR